MTGEDTHVVVPDHIETLRTDRRGRLTLGKPFANRRVTVAVIDSEPLPDDAT